MHRNRQRWVLTLVFYLATNSVYAVDFEKEVLPIFEANCIKCHGEKKASGKLRLHSAEAIQEKMAKDEELIVSGEAEKSELYERITLPADSKKRMPKGKDAKPLDKETIETIANWINEGAKFKSPEESPKEAPTEPAAEADGAQPQAPGESASADANPLPEVPPADETAIATLQQAGAHVVPLFAGSNLLDVSFALAEEPADDADQALLNDVAPQLVELDLQGAQCSNAGWGVLAELTNLRTLKLNGSNFSDDASEYLHELEHLEVLNLYGTHVTDAALAQLGGLKHLKKIFLWQTEVSYDAALALEKTIPGLEWNLGWDHPVVARKRLEKQDAEFAELLQSAESDVARLRTELKVAEEAATKAKARYDEVHQQLEKLTKPEQPAADQAAN